MTIRTLLIANRGEIACRIIRTARSMGIATVAVYSEPDRSALHVEMADEAVPLGGASPAESYLRIDALLEAAQRSGADTVHPGYGFASERADFARACAQAGLTFVGPSPEAIAAMGDKLAAKERMDAAGVPVLRSFEPDAVPDDAFPVMVKAAMGGGGKGMRVVERPQDLADAVAAARRESAAAFSDDTVFVERFLPRPRHVEVQVLGDAHGTVVHLGERECSIQRRHQKVIEESPSPMVTEALRAEMGRAAVAAAEAIGYTNAGTVELIATDDGEFFFLEMNTRLQVEHPVTELAWRVRGEPLDLVRQQLLVAAGEPLGFSQDDVELHSHAIEARLYAEDTAAGFLPTAGTLAIFEPDIGPGIRVDAGVRSGDVVSVHYDPMIAKVIAVGPTRTEAAGLLARSLERSRIHGLPTNRDLLVAALRHDAFAGGELHTGFIDEHLLPWPQGDPDPDALLVHAAAAALVGARTRRRSASVLATIPGGWRNNPSQPQQVRFLHGEAEILVGYRPSRDGSWVVSVDDEDHRVVVHAWPDEQAGAALDLEWGGRRLRVHATEHDHTWYCDSPLGHAALVEQPRFPRQDDELDAGTLTAPMPGTVVSVHAEEGDRVARGQVVVLLEAMKMEHRITAPADGTVTSVRVAAGQGVDAGAVLAVLDEET